MLRFALSAAPFDVAALRAGLHYEAYARLAVSGFKLEAPTPIFPRLEMPADA